MTAVDLVIRGGRVVTPAADDVADIGIRDGKIVQLGGDLSGADEIDASGRLVLPGGIDMHVHLTPVESGDDDVAWVDDFVSGSRAAACGGITTIGNITFPRPGERPTATVHRVAEEAERDSIVDFVLHPVLLDPSAENLADVPVLAEQGHTSIKIFMIVGEFDARVYDYLRALELAGANGMLTLIHCEDACIISRLTERLLAEGRADLSNYPTSRPIYSEAVAVTRAVALAEAAGAPIYIVHLSSRDALDAAERARARGLPVYVETRPIYLYFTDEIFSNPEGPLYVGNPPLRRAEDVAALWAGLSAGTIQTCCTDHAPWTRDQKLDPEHTIANPLPGVSDLETLMPVLFSEGVVRGRLSLRRFVEVTSTNAARLFGLFPQKGTIAVGSDADLAIWDPEFTKRVNGSEGQSRAGYSVYDGWDVTGWPMWTLSRGEVIVRDGNIVAGNGRGSWLTQGTSGKG
ncbi:MAG TPA: amidohydrolase family protein [Chloroflexota bacterium]|nr:amidohydrolase family protein [Chloroflexota bacterium]